ncbi:ABC transporter ATP-binding protein [candidate division KSB1 bacterium]|nr:ABC transporter ATP-binding protein [candidate division KSB1 bacterium]
MANALLEVYDLTRHFKSKNSIIRAVENVSFSIKRGETLGLVGESGSGKSTVAKLILRLLDITAGRVLYDGADISSMPANKLRPYRRRMQMIPQDPFSSLNPQMSINASIREPLKIHRLGNAREQENKVMEMMEQVGIDPDARFAFPGEFSGGQLQRIGIARALILRPEFIICDEPVSALDVSIQAQILNLLRDLQKEFQLTYLFIAHNLAVVERISDRVAVMYLGHLMEFSDVAAIYEHPLHPYTMALLKSVPRMDVNQKSERFILSGDIPSSSNPPQGCVFNTRCPVKTDICFRRIPGWRQIRDGHWVACHLAKSD